MFEDDLPSFSASANAYVLRALRDGNGTSRQGIYPANAGYKKIADDPKKAEYFVRVEWIETMPESKAVNEVGLFGNQNTVCQPSTPKWRHTVERLKTYFGKWENQ